MEEDTEYVKLPVEDRCVHKLWKARVHGYEEAAKLFRSIDDEKSPEFNKYLGLIKKFAIDSNAVAQEKGLEAVLAYVENSGVAGKTVGDVMSGVITKCIAAPKTKTKELAVQITLMYIEIEKSDAVQEELLKGMEHKNPKIVAACVSAITQALREFGPKVVNIKPLIKKMPVLLEDRDKGVREEGKAMVVEIYKWIGDSLKSQLSSLKPVQVTELEAEFEKVKGEKVTPTRYLKSQQQKQAKLAAEAAAGDAEDEPEDEEDGAAEIDPYELLEPVDILSKLPKDFFEKLEAKKWQERKEAVDTLEQLLQNAEKLESGDYGDVVRALKKVISKDTNVMVVAVAGKCLAGLANGLKKRFQPYSGACIPCILEKFREKKQNVVLALRDAIDAIYLSTTIEAIQEDVLAALENKNPQVKAETTSFLARCFTKCTPMMLNKKLLKAYTTALLKTLNESDPTVRDNSAEALGTAMKVVGEKQIMAFMPELDNIKMTKIKECCDKAVIVAKVPKSERPTTAPAKMGRTDAESGAKTSAGSTAPKPVKRPTSASSQAGNAAKKPPAKKAGGAGSAGGPKAKATTKAVEKDLSSEEVDERASAIFPEDVLSGLGDANWKTRLSAVEQFTQIVSEMEPNDVPTQVLIRTLNKKPGLKDTNFQVLKARLEAVKLMAETTQFSSTALDYCVTDIADKLGDVKNGTLAAETLTSLSEATKLDLVACEVLNFAFNQKSPKVQQEALSWLATAIKEFGFIVDAKAIMDNVKKAISATHPGVRNAGITFAGNLYVYMGPQLKAFFESEKPALQQQIFAEFEKHSGETPPSPIRGKTKKTDEGCEEEEEERYEAPVNQKVNIHDLMPHVDISSHITEALLNELADRNWKVRNEALQKLANVLSDNKLITNNLGELPPALAQRLVDSNSKIAAAALAISESLGTAMGAQCKTHVRTLFPGFLQGMGDSKVWIRTAAASCINTWGEQCGYKEFFDGEMIGDALKAGSPTLRAELWAWLTDKLPTMPPKSIPKDELLICLPHLYSNMEDRNAEVRKNAQEAALPFMMHLGYETMVKAAEKLKPGSRTNIVVALDKARANLPAKPLPKKKAATPVNDEDMEQKTVKSGGAKVAAGSATKVVGKGKVPPKTAGRKKDDDTDTSPLLQSNNLKNQRAIDEQKLKVLKWNFTSPREEFVDLLKDQMTTANVNKTLMANMFHSDFKYHLKAIDALNEDLPNNPSATVANLDLILKWMTLRFFDTNPSVILKGLEYLQTVFSMLIEEEYNMFETEASSFIPYLILKIGDPKDAVRNSVRALLKQIESVYPATKIFAYVMEGLKSKNARQRTECLDQLGSLILNYGVSVCQPNANAALKEVARQISDRDNSVRNAALNCVVQAYYIEGDRVYKMIGQISDKDLSLLEERIKRAAKNRPPPRAPPAQISKQQHQQQSQPQKMVRQGSEGTIKKEMPEVEQEEEQESSPPPPVMSSITVHKETRARSLSPGAPTGKLQEAICSSTSLSTDDLRAVGTAPKQRPVSTGPFGLDFELLERIEGKGLNLCTPKLAEFDLRDIINDTPINIPSVKTGYQTLSPPPALQPVPVATKVMNVEEKADYMLDSTIANIADPDTSLAIQSIVQLESLMQSDKVSRLTGKVDQIILACVMQLKLLTANNVIMPNEQLSKCYRSVFMLLMTLYNNVNLPKRVSKDVLRDLMDVLISLLVNKHMEELDNGESYVRIVNTLVVRVIEKSDHTNVTCALIKSLHDCVENSPSPRFTELVMKCLWKVVKLLPSWESEADFDMILYDIHLFLKDYPTSVWKKKQSDTPIRTIKTILHCMTKMKGNRILLHLNRIDNIKDSELQSYLVKLIKTVKQESSPAKKETKSHHRLSKTTHELLSEIFKKIGSKDQTKEDTLPQQHEYSSSMSSASNVEATMSFGQGKQEGLSLLYDFKQQHPEADVDPFLRKASQFFQDYVDRGLQSIEMERKRAAEAGGHPSSLTAASSLSSLGIIDHSPMTPSQGDAPSEISASNPSLGYASHIRSIKQRVSIDGGEDSDSGADSKMALYYLERLRALQEQAGHNPSAVLLDSKQQLPRGRDDNGTNDENLNRTSVLDNRSEEIHSVQRSSSNSDVDALRRRVEELRGSLR